MADLLEIDSVSYAVDDRLILKDVYLQLETGRVTGLLGRNGSGKSSLLKILFGAMKAAHQSIRWNGNYVRSPRKIPGLIAMCPQFDFLPASYTITSILELYQVQNTGELLDYLQVSPKSKVRNLSGGKKRLLQVLLCLYLDRKFILLDEPFSQLAPVTVELISAIIRNKSRHSGILIIDHNHREVTNLSDDLYLCHDGAVRVIQGELENSPYIS